MVKEINDGSFQKEVFDCEMPVVVDFWAPWCGPCNMLAPVMEELEKEYGDKIKFVKLDVDNNPNIADQYEVFSIPTVIIFKQETIGERFAGFAPKKSLEEKLKKYL